MRTPGEAIGGQVDQIEDLTGEGDTNLMREIQELRCKREQLATAVMAEKVLD